MINKRKMSRREFFISAGRGLALTGAVCLGVFKIRSKESIDPEQCTGSWICSKCSRSSSCHLPQAKSYRQREDLPAGEEG